MFHDVVDLVVSFDVFVGLFGFDIIHIRKDSLWLEIHRLMRLRVPVIELILHQLIFVLYLSEFFLLFDVVQLFLLIFGLHLKKLILSLFGHLLHSVTILMLILRENRV